MVSRGDHDQYEVGDRAHIRRNNGTRGRMRYNILSGSLLAVDFIAISTGSLQMGGKIVLYRELAASDLAFLNAYVITDFTAQSEMWAHCRIRSCQSRPSTVCVLCTRRALGQHKRSAFAGGVQHPSAQ